MNNASADRSNYTICTPDKSSFVFCRHELRTMRAEMAEVKVENAEVR